MHSPLLNCFIFVCKLITCISIFLSLNSHHWIRDSDGRDHRGPQQSCYDYGHLCNKREAIAGGIWFFYSLALLNLILESLNILLLCKRKRSPINLILEELGLLTIIVFFVAGTLISLVGFLIVRKDFGETLDWSYFVFLLSVILTLIDLVCSIIRVVSYCRENSFRSKTITYTSTANDETVHIQS